MKRKTGFTLVELLVVIAVIALLMSILMPVLRNARDQAMRIICKSREKNIVLGMTVYADNHSNRIPPGAGAWPWDLARDTSRDIVRNMGIDVTSFRRLDNNPNPPGSHYVPLQYAPLFYCPANTVQKRMLTTNWLFTNTGNPYASGYRVAGYIFMWYAGWNGQGNRAFLASMGPEDNSVDPSKKWVDRTDIPQASERELIADATLSNPAAAGTPERLKYPYGNFGKVMIGGNPIDASSHIITDDKAAGGNIGFVDGHVEWRSWKEMKIRWRSPSFWW